MKNNLHPTKQNARSILLSLLFLIACNTLHAQPDLYIKDTPADNGTEPNPDTGPLWISEDIWTLIEPDPNWQPAPFTGNPSWSVPAHQNPEYRDISRFSKPNWVYVKITNKGNQPSNVTEVLKLYWAKASTGLSWPLMWDDYEATPAGCSGNLFLGEEITKPRSNAANLTNDLRNQLKLAIQQLDQTYYSSDGVSWWDKQDQIHEGTHVHGTAEFIPWHRELINRYELLIRAINPKLRLPYWDWTTDPNNSTNGFDFFTPTFMGNDQGRAGEPFNTFDANEDCSLARKDWLYAVCNGTFDCPNQPQDFTLPPLVIDREVLIGQPPDIASDVDIINSSDAAPNQDEEFHWFWNPGPGNYPNSINTNHGNAHGNIGATIRCGHTAFADPFVYLLHSDLDKIWSMWQRDPGNLWRLDPLETYGNFSTDFVLSNNMKPWDGTVEFGNPIPPWTVGSTDILVKNCYDPSVVNPPIYDVARLTVPVLQPGESVIMQMPWYPPNPADYSCFGADQSHFCLLARIETSPTVPFGMTYAEGSDVYINTKNNNNIAWKNVTVEDLYLNAGKVSCVTVHNVKNVSKTIKLTIDLPVDNRNKSLLNYATVKLNLGADMYQAWNAGGQLGLNVQYLGNNTVKILNKNAWLGGINMDGDEMQTICFAFVETSVPAQGDNNLFHCDLKQVVNNLVVGGERFTLSLNPAPSRFIDSVDTHSGSEIFAEIYPNPANEQILITSDSEASQFLLKIINLSGQTVCTLAFTGKATVDVRDYKAGMYILSIMNVASGHQKIERLMIQ